MYNSLPVIEEIVSIYENDERVTIKSEIERRRTRLGAAGPEQIRKEVGREVWSTSKVWPPTSASEGHIEHPQLGFFIGRFTLPVIGSLNPILRIYPLLQPDHFAHLHGVQTMYILRRGFREW